ncbi:MAG: hypothetical protein AAGA56_30395, partial [Myxococcota bacterium]
MNDDELFAIWKDQPTFSKELDMEQVKKKVSRFELLVHLRNFSEWAAALLVIVIFTGIALRETYPTITRIGAILICIAAALVAHRLLLQGRLRPLADPSVETERYLATHRENLLNQAELLESVWRWYLGPFIPGFIAVMAGFGFADPARWFRIAVVTGGTAVFFVLVGWVNGKAAA